MMWVELLSRHHEVIARYRCGDDVRIGRAYDNDVVIDDPHVAPHHLRIARDEAGLLQAEDLGTRNGLHTTDSDARQTRVVLDGDRILRLGRSLLRVRTPDFVVPPERVPGRVLHTAPIIAVLGVVAIALSLLTLWLNETQQTQPSNYLLAVIGVAFLVLVWTTVWSVLSRIFTGVAHFDRHLSIALAGLLVFYLYDQAVEFGAYAFSWRAAAEYAYVVNWLLFAGLCFAHLRAMGPMRLRAKASAVTAVALAAIAVQTVSRMDPASAAGQQTYLQTLKPPFLRLRTAQSLDTFLEDTGRIKGGLDKARTAPSTGRGWFDNDDED